jgi:hypothetical protein
MLVDCTSALHERCGQRRGRATHLLRDSTAFGQNGEARHRMLKLKSDKHGAAGRSAGGEREVLLLAKHSVLP